MTDLDTNKAEAFDRALGSNIRRERVRRGLSLKQLAAAMGVSCQQAHKYEKGINRISVSRLHTIAHFMGLSIEVLLPGQKAGADESLSASRLALEMARNFARIPSLAKQRAVSQLIRSLAECEPVLEI